MVKEKELTRHGQKYDSKEEIEFQIFLEECERYGLVQEAKYQPETYTLAPKSYRFVTKRFKTKADRVEKKTLFQAHVYTPDWEIVVAPEFFKVFGNKHKMFFSEYGGTVLDPVEPDFQGTGICLVDVKGGFNLYGGDRIFPIHQKLMWSLHSKIVNKVHPSQLFSRLGVVPDEIKWMKNRKQKTPKKAYQFVDTFEDKINQGIITLSK